MWLRLLAEKPCSAWQDGRDAQRHCFRIVVETSGVRNGSGRGAGKAYRKMSAYLPLIIDLVLEIIMIVTGEVGEYVTCCFKCAVPDAAESTAYRVHLVSPLGNSRTGRRSDSAFPSRGVWISGVGARERTGWAGWHRTEV